MGAKSFTGSYGSFEYRLAFTACEAQLRATVDVDAVERLARADQQAMIERLGG
jgi:hypothetical protein